MWRTSAVLVVALLCTACASQQRRDARARGHAELATADAALRRRPNFSTISYGDLGDKYLMPLLAGNPVEWYCGCAFDTRNKKVKTRSCGFQRKAGSTRSQYRIEWEHVVPRSWLAASLGCASTSDCAGDEQFNRMATDPYALVPALNALNGARSNHVFWEVEGETRPYGRCDFEVAYEEASGLTFIEPPDALKGDLARITLYMVERYGIELPVEGAELWYRAWSRSDPVDARERAWIRAIREQVADWDYPGVE